MASGAHPTADARRAAAWADLRERVHPPAFAAAVADQLAAVVPAGRPVLDVGAGHGHLARHLRQRGVAVVASDLSPAMLAHVGPAAPALVADVVALPHPDGCAGAVVAAHVLHVVPAWGRACAELDRVAGADGVVLVHLGGGGRMSASHPGLRDAFAARLPPEALRGNAVAADPSALDAALARLGRDGDDLPEIRVERQETVRGLVAWMEGNPWSWPGPSTDRDRAVAARAALLWAARERIDPDEPFAATAVARWRRYRRR